MRYRFAKGNDSLTTGERGVAVEGCSAQPFRSSHAAGSAKPTRRSSSDRQRLLLGQQFSLLN
jgi:hypothetical protein